MSSADLLQTALTTEDPESRRRLVEASRVLALRENILACTKCELRQNATAPVPWRGGPSAIAVVGEAPGRQEDMEGKPFVGVSGKLLETALRHAGIESPSFINAICCRPVGNKWQQAVEVGADKACDPWFWQQLEMSEAWIVIPLGNAARSKFRRDDKDYVGITGMRGQAYWWKRWLIMPTFHPAYILRNRQLESTFVEDLTRARKQQEDDDTPVKLLKGYDASSTLETLRQPQDGYDQTQKDKLNNHLRLRGWVMARSHWLDDDIVLVRDEKVRVPDKVKGVVYSVRELSILSHMDRNWGDAKRLHNAKKSLGGVIVS